MHKCINNSEANVYHLEQWVDKFFPYSREQLGFDQPVTIVFQSDEENASKMLGKTAHYDPESLEVMLYIDNRHPKDVMRSLSHELVHHAQNCRGDLQGGCDKPGWNQACVQDTGPGYAQRDPHMRKMEREAYTKGNLIFRDFEDLIKTGKINIEIDFSDSGEPKMSLKEWKNNEINTKLMKKWGLGLLKESKAEETNEGPATRQAKDFKYWAGRSLNAMADVPEKFAKHLRKMDPERKEELSKGGKPLTDFLAGLKGQGGTESADETGDQPSIGDKAAGKLGEAFLSEDSKDKETENYGKNVGADEREEDSLEGHLDAIEHHLEGIRGDIRHDEEHMDEGSVYRDDDDDDESVNEINGDAAGADDDEGVPGARKISTQEAKEITRRIVERIKKESN